MKYLIASISFALIVMTFIFGYTTGHAHHYEYQVRVIDTSAYVYSDGKLVGIAPYGHDGIDSVILKDNE